MVFKKNLGPAGVTIVIVRDDLVKPVAHIPSILNYSLFVKKNSMFNTPPVFAIYATGLVLKWLKQQGGLAEIERLNRKKSALLYDYLDDSKLFTNYIKKSDRSLTNVPFTTDNADLDNQVIQAAADTGLMNLKATEVSAACGQVSITPCQLREFRHSLTFYTILNRRIRTAPPSNNLRVSTLEKNPQIRNFPPRRLTLRLLTTWIRSLILGQLRKAETST